MANRRAQQNGGGRRMDYGRSDLSKNFNRGGVSPWQGAGPSAGLPNLLPLGGNSPEATLAFANNLISNLLQSRQSTVPSLLDMPMRRDFAPDMGRYDRGYGPNRMGNQGHFRRTGTYNRAGERINTNRKPFRPNDGPRNKQISPKKDAEKAKPEVKCESTEEASADNATVKTETVTEEEKKEPPKTSYDDINPQMLKCHICNKSMWDGRSFENHLNGRAHGIMMQKTAESYALTADTMRQEFKIREMKRTRKSGQMTPRDFYCAMCDMYAGDGAIHRTTVGHRKLKKYLHPNCASCHKEMPTRIELDEHRLTADHLRQLQDVQEFVVKPKPEVMVLSTLDMEQSYVRFDRLRKKFPGPGEDRQEGKEDGDNNEDVEMKKGGGESEAKKEEDDSDKTIIDYKEGDDLSNFTPDMVPSYSTARGVGRSYLSEFKCVQCRLCRKLLDTQETAETHLRTWKHHQFFLKMLREKTATEGEGTKRVAPAAEGEDENGDSKRRKMSDADGDAIMTEVTNDADPEPQGNGEDEGGLAEDTLLEGGQFVEGEGSDKGWEETVDEILEDEKNDTTLEAEENLLQEEVEEEKPRAPSPPPVKPKVSTPRGRGRGRRGARH